MTDFRADIGGEVATGYNPVLDAFRNGIGDLAPGGGAFAAYVDGAKVVDLWAGDTEPGIPWQEDTLGTVHSSTKGMTALCAQLLFDGGHLDPDARVAHYWPEFAQMGKSQATVKHVLSHTVGVLGFEDPGSLLDWEGRGWSDYEEIARRLAAAEPWWNPGDAIAYHAVSFGWLVGELVRRITGTTIGEFFRGEVAIPQGADVWIGTPPEVQERLADVLPVSYDREPDHAVALDRYVHQEANRRGSAYSAAIVFMHGTHLWEQFAPFMNHSRVRASEIAAGNASATARGLAKIYATLGVDDDSPDGLVSRSSTELFSTEVATGEPFGMSKFHLPDGSASPLRFSFALGYQPNASRLGGPSLLGPSPKAFGHTGAGGQVGFCDPTNCVAVGFVRNQLSLTTTLSDALIYSLYDCLDAPGLERNCVVALP